MKFFPNFMPTHLAAMAHRDPDQACRLILRYFPEAPGIPRLTKSTRMYLEGIPCLVVDSARRKLWFDISPRREKELIEFYDKCEAEDLNYFAISRESAPGMHLLLERLKENPPAELKLVHIQTPGPISWGLSITDGEGTAAFHNGTMRDILVKTLAMKARWQEWKVKEMLPGIQTLVDFAEPSLVVHTSAVGSGPREEIVHALNEVMGAVEGLTCIHCCANIDWSILMETHTDALSFDAYEYADKIALYPKELRAFLERGGMLAWGIVPTSDEKIARERVDTLMSRLENSLDMLVNAGIDRQKLLHASMITPSCATSMMSLELGERAFHFTRQISERMREKYSAG